MAPHADYVVVNVSSPNTPGLRDLQAVAALRPLLVAVRAALDEAGGARRVPLLVKIAPDLGDDDVDAVADLALELGLDGIIATNTTIARTGLASDAAAVRAAGPGGLSGPPLAPRALAVLRRLRARTGDRLVLVAAGGIETPEDAWERLRAGATFVQAYTGFVYGGPRWPRPCTGGSRRWPAATASRPSPPRSGRTADPDGPPPAAGARPAVGPGAPGRPIGVSERSPAGMPRRRGRRTPQSAGFRAGDPWHDPRGA